MLQRKVVVILSFLLFHFFGQTQNCDLTLSGFVLDKGTDIPLEFSNIYLDEQAKGTVADASGFFELKNLCPGEIHLDISHIGCEAEHIFIDLTKDTSIKIYLHHHAELLDEIHVHGNHEDNSAQNSSSVNRKVIEQNSHKNLSDILENIAGVSVLKNGSGISKPVIHGLYGNRVAILNNGITQSGQQWGNDHAPEIDPFVADHLSVVKGASALAYGGNSLGSVVLVEAGSINSDPHLHGSLNYGFQSNGLGNTLNTQLEKNDSWAAWRVSGTLKMQGDTRTPDYFLTNTGKREGNIAVQLEKDFSDLWKNELYISSFNTEIGVLRGSHIGNLTDLENAIGAETPLFTVDNFSYKINAPRQKVNHHLLKFESKYFFNEHQLLKLKYGWQLNDRKEFDIRRGNRTDKAALSLRQFSNFLELAYNHTFENHAFLKTGFQFDYVANNNVPGTGISPLIPNYDSQTASAYLIYQKEHGKLFYEIGGRFDIRNFTVKTISGGSQPQIERFEHDFQNYSLSAGLKYEFTEGFKTNLNVGYMLRSPEVNEMYSSGLHQGVSGIEEGTRTLSQEKSLKAVASFDWYFKQKLFIQALGYFQPVSDFIFLEPQNEFRLTIRGAFPVFIYKQTDVLIYGTDFLLSFEPKENVKWLLKYAFVEGEDRSGNRPLVNMPANNLFSSLTWSFKDSERFKQNSFSVTGKYVFEQKDLLPEQDFLPPPDAYFLLGLNAETNLELGHDPLRISLSVENLLNTKYRDYLNRLRYFADEPGINFVLSLNYEF